MRSGLIVLVCLGVLGCSAPDRGGSDHATEARFSAQPSSEQDVKREANFAYTHNWTIEMPEVSVVPRFQRARQRCLEDATLQCSVLGARVNQGRDGHDRTGAWLQIRLPHDKIPAFEEAVLAPLSGEKKGDAAISFEETKAEDLNQPVSDNAARLAQLKDYLVRLTNLTARPDIKVDELIQIEREVSQTQAQIEGILAQQNALRDRIDRDTISIGFTAPIKPGEAVAEAWRHVGEDFNESVIDVARFVLQAIPWLPVVALGFLVLGLGWRLIRAVQRKAVPNGAPKPA